MYVCFTCCTAFISPESPLARSCNTLTRHSVIDALREICKEYHERLFLCESQKWDLEYEVRRRDYEVQWPGLLHQSGVLVVLSYHFGLTSPGYVLRPSFRPKPAQKRPPARPPISQCRASLPRLPGPYTLSTLLTTTPTHFLVFKWDPVLSNLLPPLIVMLSHRCNTNFVLDANSRWCSQE